jgi:hypothetical protein
VTELHQARQTGRQMVSGFTAALLVAGAVLTGIFARVASAANPGSTVADGATQAPPPSTPPTTSRLAPPVTTPSAKRQPGVTRSPVTLAPPTTAPAPSRRRARVTSGGS